MSRKHFLTFALTGILILSVIIIYVMRETQFVDSQPLQTSPSPTKTRETVQLSTIEIERTAIAVFTQNPTLALSSTLFYAEIIYNEVMRNLTEIPSPKRNCYLNPTNVPANPSTPIAECGPFIVTILFGDEARELIELMKKAGIEGTVGIESTGLQQIDKSDAAPFVAVQSRLGFAITVETINNREALVNTITKLVDFLVKNWGRMTYVSTNAEILIELKGSDGSRSILTTYTALSEAHQSGLTGESLIEAIGNFSESGES